MTEESTQTDSQRAEQELAALESILRKTRRELRGPVLFEGFAWFLVTLGSVAVSAQLVGLLAGEDGPRALRLVLTFGSGAAMVGAFAALIAFVRTKPGLEDVARLLQRHAPQFRNDIVAALQFGRELRDGRAESHGWSPALAHAHLKRTTRGLLGAVDGEGTLARHVPVRSPTPALVALGGCLVLLVAPYLIAPDMVRDLWLEAAFPSDDAKEGEPEHRPLVGEIDLLYAFPPYSDLTPRFEPFTTGHIETLVGTEVTLKTYPLVDGAKFEMVIQTADGSRVVPMTMTGDRLEATLLLTKAGSYKFRATRPDGTIVEDGIERPIVLQPDSVPTITVTSHPQEIEVSPDEILTIEFEVSDDYGIESVSRAYAFGSDDPTIRPLDLPELTTVPKSLSSKFELDLTPLALQPKDSVALWIEATDNNSLTGPGIGKSTPILLRVASPEDRHMKVIAAEQAVLEALLEVLADFLENPAGQRKPDARGYYRQVVPTETPLDQISIRFGVLHEAHQQETSVLAEMAQVVERMKEDPLMAKRDVTLFEGLYEQLYELNRDGEDVFNLHASDARQGTLFPDKFQDIANHVAKTEDALEKGLIRLENLLATQKMDAVKATAEDIRELKERLKELLEKYRDTRDPELKKAILREIQRLRQRMAELLDRMRSQLKELPQEHVNLEALETAKMESDAAKMGESLERIEDLLEKGDVDGALAALEEMTSSLDAMTQDMNERFEAAEPEGMREMDKALSELMDKANDLESRQRDLERRTRDVQERLDEAQRKRTEELLEQQTREIAQMAAQQRQRLERIAERELAPHDLDAVEQARKRVEDLEKMLEGKDIEQALQKARMSQEDLRALEFSMDLSERYTEPDTERGRAVRETSKELGTMNPEARKIVRSLEEIMERARSQQGQGSSPELQQLAREQQDVQKQADQLGQDVRQASERFPMLEQQLAPPLENARNEMGEAQHDLGQRETQQALDHQRGALESLRELKQSMKDALQKQKQGGREGSGAPRSKERVAIPEKDGRSREQFREDVMKGMKEDRLENYESEIERYYESLMQ